MAHHQQSLDGQDYFDFSRIFVGREQQIDEFERVLQRWRDAMSHSTPDEADDVPFNGIPAPDARMQGLVVMLFGRGGFGKTTLLRRFYDIAVKAREQTHSNMLLCGPLNWEAVLEGRARSDFNPPQGQSIDPLAYFRTLCDLLAPHLKKTPRDFRTFQQVATNVEKARNDANKALDNIKIGNDEELKAVRNASIDIVSALLSTAFPASKLIVENAAIKKGADATLQLSGEQLKRLYQHFHRHLGDRLNDFLDPARKLAVAFGTDLHTFARNAPLLFFFDTYEEADEGDALLRVVMGAAGLRVGWVIAGRDNLWSGPGQRKRSIALEYGYKEIVTTSRSLPINFNSEDVGVLTASEVKDYFDQLCTHYPIEPPLERLTEQDIQSIMNVTGGIPLAVNIAADLYTQKTDLRFITEEVEGQREIIEGMVRRYLLHTRINEQERATLYAIAMLRRPTQRPALVAALGLTPDEAKIPNRFDEALTHLHRRYSFIFTEQGEPTLHQEVRKFLRLWLLEDRDKSDILAINERLKAAHEERLAHLEKQRTYPTLKARMQDAEWTGIYLDLTEQRYWLDPIDGLCHLLPFMIAAAIYQRDINDKEAKDVGNFFTSHVHSPYHFWWEWVTKSLLNSSSRLTGPSGQSGLQELLKLLKHKRLNIASPFEMHELEAALFWLLGEAYQYENIQRALEYYEQAFHFLENEARLKLAIAGSCRQLASQLNKEKRYDESSTFSSRAIELRPDYAWAYLLHGVAYGEQQHYVEAIEDFTHSITLDPHYDSAYFNRGNAYYYQQHYLEAIEDHTQAIRLDPDAAHAYNNRAYAYLRQKNIGQAQADFAKAAEIEPQNIKRHWMVIFASLDEHRPNIAELAARLDEIATIDTQSEASILCSAVALGLRKQLRQALEKLEQVMQKYSEYANFWKGMFAAYYYPQRPQIAVEAIELALHNDPYSLPPVLLRPLYWMREDNATFFEQYAKPILEREGV